MVIEVGYWNLRGLVGFIRLIDVYTEEGIKFKTYEVEKRDEWLEEKAKMNETGEIEFPNLPWMKDGDIKISQSLAILKYLAKKHNLLHDGTVKGETMANVIEQQIIDLRTGFSRFNYGGTQPKEEYEVVLSGALSQWDKFLKGKEFANGKLSYIDFMFWELLDMLSLVFPETMFDKNENLLAYYKRFAQIPKIHSYLESDQFQVSPISGPMARYGGDDSLKRTKKFY